MAISYPVTPPTTPKFSRMRWLPKDIAAIDVNSYTGIPTVYDWMAGYRVAEFSLAPMKSGVYEPWAAFFASLKGVVGTFYAGPPPGWGATPRGVATGSPLINGAGQTGEDIATDGWTNNTTNILRAGDWVSFENRLYRQLVDVNSGASTGPATLTLWPRVRNAPSDNAVITVNSPLGIFKLLDNVPEDLEPVLMAGFQFTAMEVR